VAVKWLPQRRTTLQRLQSCKSSAAQQGDASNQQNVDSQELEAQEIALSTECTVAIWPQTTAVPRKALVGAQQQALRCTQQPLSFMQSEGKWSGSFSPRSRWALIDV
jgi:hypothetical protein